MLLPDPLREDTMKRPLRLLTGLLLVLVMAAIAVPLATHLTPGVLAAIDPPPPVEPPVTPALQIPPTSVAVPDVVTPLSPSAPAPDPAVLGPALEAALQIPGPGTFAGTVIDPADGTVLYVKEAGRLQAPASTIAEALARVAALDSGRPASFGGATEALAVAAAGIGVPEESLLIGDAAGLSVRNAVSPEQLAILMRATTASEEPGLAAVAGWLPIAGLTGTLATRFSAEDGPAVAGAGTVRAKTGTLNAVTALTGHVVTSDGRLLVFSFLAAGLDGATVEARSAGDGAAAVLAACGCR